MNAPEKMPETAQNSTTTPSIAEAYCRAFAEIQGARKDADGHHGQYADLPSIIMAIKPHLIDNGLSMIQKPKPTDGAIEIETVLMNEAGEQLSLGAIRFPAAKNDPQGYGGATTYCRRFALQTVFCLPTYDDDGQAAMLGIENDKKRRIAEEHRELYQEFQDASLEGMDALKKFLREAKGRPGRDLVWKSHGESLKSAAEAADENADA